MPLPLVFEAVARIVRAVTVPVTADLLDGYGLAAEELVDRLLDAGAVGCNLEDSDQAYSGRLLDRTAVAARITAVRRVAQRVGVDVVINARIDTSLHNRDADPAGTWADIVGRARRYLDAGADCVFPFGMTDPQVVAALVDELGAPVNASVALGGSVAAVAAAGASRVSIGPRAHHAALVALGELASQLLARTD
jgi:2-methylisocitrate lyase-like PEP mutase family enzyme